MGKHRHRWSKPFRLYDGRTAQNCRSDSGGTLLCFFIRVKVGRGKRAKWELR